MKIDTKALWEACKEVLRLAVLGAISAVVMYFTGVLESLDPTSIEAIILTVVLRFADKLRHEDSSSSNGLLPF